MLEVIEKLTGQLKKLPGIGSRSAERIALRLASAPRSQLRDLVTALNDLDSSVVHCSRCGALTGVSANPCRYCSDPGRDGRALCVVEEPSDVEAIESSGGIRCRYHVLMGRISPMGSKGPWDLRLDALLKRIDQEKFEELVLALGTDVESDATAAFIKELLKDRKVKVTRLAFGLPVGSGVAYSDPVTLQRALKGRQSV